MSGDLWAAAAAVDDDATTWMRAGRQPRGAKRVMRRDLRPPPVPRAL